MPTPTNPAHLIVRPKSKRGERYPKETWVHLQLITHIETQRLDLRTAYAHPPLGGVRNKRAAHWLRRLGAKPGQPDLMFYAPCVYEGRQWSGLALELKRRGRGRLSNSQKHWLHQLNQCGWLTSVAFGLTAALSVVESVYPRDHPPVLLHATQHERRDAVISCLEHETWSLLPNTTIGAYCGVSEALVRKIKRAYCARPADIEHAA